jgi:hypothetical protein
MICKPEPDQNRLADDDAGKRAAVSERHPASPSCSHPMICTQYRDQEAKVDDQRADFRGDDMDYVELKPEVRSETNSQLQNCSSVDSGRGRYGSEI